jgi:ribonuclease P/MRP protein subunit POP1
VPIVLQLKVGVRNMPPKTPKTPNQPGQVLGKRKATSNSAAPVPNAKKRKVVTINTQTLHQVFTDGQIDVNQFVKAREYEIKALEDGIKAAKHALSTRAFQQVPRDMRRRTASYNVKRVPQRLRATAKKQVRRVHMRVIASAYR